MGGKPQKPKIQAYVDRRWFEEFENYGKQRGLNQSKALEAILAEFFGGEQQQLQHEEHQRVRDDLLFSLKKQIDSLGSINELEIEQIWEEVRHLRAMADASTRTKVETTELIVDLSRLKDKFAESLERLERTESELHYFKGLTLIMWGESAAAKEIAVADLADAETKSASESADEDSLPILAALKSAEAPMALALVTPNESATDSPEVLVVVEAEEIAADLTIESVNESADSYAQLEQEIKEYFKTTGLEEPKLTQAYEGVVSVASGTMGRSDIDERLEIFFSPTHRPTVKRFAIRLCALREADLETQITEQQAIEAHLEVQREALGMNAEDYEFEGEIQITPNQILVKGKYRNSKIYTYSSNADIPDWAVGLPRLYYPGCNPEFESAIELAEPPVAVEIPEALALVELDESAEAPVEVEVTDALAEVALSESVVESANESAEIPVVVETPEEIVPVPPFESAIESADESVDSVIKPSKYQQAILDWLANGTGHGCCNALAGSGKSSTLHMAAKQLQESGISPNDIKVIVFGKVNSQDLISKFGPAWKDSIKTLHSAGFNLLRQEVGQFHPTERINPQKYRQLAQKLEYVPSKKGEGDLTRSKAIEKPEDLYKVVDLVRLTLSEPTPSTIEDLAFHYNIEGIRDEHLVARAVEQLLHQGEKQARQHIIDYTDQVWLPAKWQLGQKPWFKPYKFVLVDECQDLNAAQLELSLILAGQTGRLLYVGDPRQAIMGFAGADNRSYEKILERTGATELPLSICYRCPRSHIDLVKQQFPAIPIEPRENAPNGSIIQLEEKDLDQHLKVGDMVLSRKTAPLVTLCIKLISRGIKATVKGRDIAETIKRDLQDIAKIPGFSYGEFPRAAQQYKMLKLERYHGLDNEEQLTEQLNDKLEALLAIYKSRTDADSITALGEYIDSLFSDETSPITLSTCHRAKGLEGNRIFIIKPEDLPFVWRRQLPWQKEQEDNLHYVALTRSKSELFVVGNPNWLEAESAEVSANLQADSTDESFADLAAELNIQPRKYETDILLDLRQLANRLQVGIPTLKKWAAKPETMFSDWARRKDPDGLDWVVGPDGKSFRPALPKLSLENSFGEPVNPSLEYRHNRPKAALAELRISHPG